MKLPVRVWLLLMLLSFSLSDELLCKASIWYPDEYNLKLVWATLLLISLALDNVEGELAKEILESPLLSDADSMRR